MFSVEIVYVREHVITQVTGRPITANYDILSICRPVMKFTNKQKQKTLKNNNTNLFRRIEHIISLCVVLGCRLKPGLGGGEQDKLLEYEGMVIDNYDSNRKKKTNNNGHHRFLLNFHHT